MIKKVLYILIFLAVILSSFYGLGDMEKEEEVIKREMSLTTAASSSGVAILPESFLRSYDPVTVFYDKDYGPPGGGPLDDPSEIITISPPHPGEYKWLDSKILQFLPTIPWAPLTRYEISTGEEIKSLVTLMIPPSGILPLNKSKKLDPFTDITMRFAASLDPEKLGEMITFEIKPLPGIGEGEAVWLTNNDFEIKEMDRTSNSDNFTYQLTLYSAINYGLHITMHMKLSLDSNVPGSAASYTFQTKQQFKVRGMGSGSSNYPVASRGSVYTVEQAINCGTGRSPLFIEFSESISYPSIDVIKKFIKFEPAIKNLSFNVQGSRLYLYFNVNKETPYKVSLHHTDISSRTGRPVAPFGETSFYFYYTQLSSYLKWTQGQGIVERYGPQFFPMEGRAMEKIDLRIYRIDPLNRNFWPFPAYPVQLDEKRRPMMPGEEPEYATRMIEQIKLLGSPPVSKVISLPIDEESPGSRFGIDLKPYLSSIAGENSPGTYLVGYRLLGESTSRYYVRVAVTDLNLSTIEDEHAINFIVTSLETGRPITGAEIKVEMQSDNNWLTAITGRTNDAGQFYYQHNYDIKGSIKRITVLHGEDVLVLNPADPPPNFMNNHWFRSSSAWLSWLNYDPVRDTEKATLKGFILTERPIYRPEEDVHLIGYIRQRQQGRISAAEPESAKKGYEVIINGPGRKSWTFPVKLKSLGHYYLKFDEKNIPTGKYTAYLRNVSSGETLSSITFKKEAYRIPRFEINIAGPNKVPLDQVFKLILTADYYAGGRVVGQDVTWEVSRYPYQVRPPGFPGYIFSSDERFSERYRSDGTSFYRDVTDENGSATLIIDPTAEYSSAPRRYVVEATVRGADTQTVTTSRTVYALPPFMIGLKAEKFVKEGSVIKPEIIVIGHDEKQIAGKPLKVRLYQREWHSFLTESDFTTGAAKYSSDVVDNLIQEKEYQSTGEPLRLELPVEQSGIYLVEVLGWDNMGRMQRVQSDVYVAGETPVTWKKTEANIFETETDKNSYIPGDTATLLLKSPFQEANAMVVIEGPLATSYHWVEITGGQGLFSFDIKENMTPRLPVHILLLRGRIGGTGKQLSWKEDRGRPIAMANTTWVEVTPVENKTFISLEHEKTKLPGSELRLTVKMTDGDAYPLDGEVALWLVDKAVLSLDKELFRDPLDDFIDPVSAHIRIRETRNEVVGNLTVEEMPGGGGDDEMYDIEKTTPLVERTTVRRNFKTVPYFNDSITVINGEAVINITLPDNLTDFAVRAVGISGYDRFGTAKSEVSVRLPIIVQSSLPRFVRPGDQFTAGGIGRIVEGEGGSGSVQVQVDGLTIETGKAPVTGDSQKVDWEINRPQQIYFPFVVPKNFDDPDRSDVSITIAVERDYDKANDGFELKLPIKNDIEKRLVDNFVSVTPGADIPLPEITEEVRPGSVKRTILFTTEPGIIKILNGMYFLANYQHLCTEQRISKLYPGVALADLLKTIGFDTVYYADSENFKDLTIYLENTLKPNGLYSYWPGSQGYVNLTAYVVEFLTAAKQAGFVFDEKLLSRPVSALKEALRSDYSYFISGHSFRERIASLVALEATGHYESGYAQDLLVSALNSDLYSRGKILNMFLNRGLASDSRAQKLLTNLWDSTVFKLDPDDKEVFEGLEYYHSYWGGLILSDETKTISSVATALFNSDPDNPRIRLMIDEIISRAGSDGWGSTTTNVACITTLAAVLDVDSTGSGSGKFELHQDSGVETIETGGKPVSSHKDNSAARGFLRYVSGEDSDIPDVYMSVEYIPGSTGDKLEQLNEGFVVKREHLGYGPDRNLQYRNEVKAGESFYYTIDDIIEEHVQVINSKERNFVAVRVPFAAGFELLNPELATAPKEAVPEGRLTREPSYAMYEDDQVTFYYDTLSSGTFDFYFRLRAGFEGDFVQPPARAELMYDLKTKGRSGGAKIVITPEEEK